ncbi:MAG TPA: hypothetical protein DEO64_16085 [Alcaligenes faecalis]|nr:hypothetical protein [Alcaligenes faecalis]
MGIKLNEDYSVETQRWLGVAIGFGCGLLSLAIFKAFGESDIEWPSWIQAVGSLVAVIVAFWAGLSQSRILKAAKKQDMELVKNDFMRKRGCLLAIIKRAVDEVKRIQGAVNGPKVTDDYPMIDIDFAVSKESFQATVAALVSISPFDLESEENVRNFLSFLDDIRAVKKLLDLAENQYRNGGPSKEEGCYLSLISDPLIHSCLSRGQTIICALGQECVVVSPSIAD